MTQKWTNEQMQMFQDNQRLGYYFAHKWKTKTTAIQENDLIQLCLVGLAKAVRSFDPERGYHFATFASKCIQNEIFMELRRMRRECKYIAISCFDVTDPDSSNVNDAFEFAAFMGTEDKYVFIDKELIGHLIKILNERERHFINMWFFEEKSQRDIVAESGLSQSYVSRIIKQALEKMRSRATRIS